MGNQKLSIKVDNVIRLGITGTICMKSALSYWDLCGDLGNVMMYGNWGQITSDIKDFGILYTIYYQDPSDLELVEIQPGLFVESWKQAICSCLISENDINYVYDAIDHVIDEETKAVELIEFSKNLGLDERVTNIIDDIRKDSKRC